jgi:20S proteasome alpha/beta subunit
MVLPKPKKRLPRREKMTIGLGFRCSDGLVIASDTKESDGLTKRYVDKIYTVRDGDFSCALTAAGTADLIEMFSHELRTQLTKCPRTSRTWPVLELISKGILTTLFDESIVPFLSHPKDERPSMSALVGFCLDGKTSLYEMRPPRTVLSVREHHAATGFGDFAAVPLLDRFHLKRQTMKATSDLAAYILKHVKAGVDHCEGDSDIVLQGNDGTIYGYNPGWKGHVHIAAMEKWGDEVDRAIGMLFKAATDHNEEQIERSIKELRDAAGRTPAGNPDNLYPLDADPDFE